MPARGPFPFQVARPHTSLASLFAARFRVGMQPSHGPSGDARARAAMIPHPPRKRPSGRPAAPSALQATRCNCYEALRRRCDNGGVENQSSRCPPGRRCRGGARRPARTSELHRARATRSASCRATAPAPRRGLRERIGGAVAAIVALIAKFFAAIKGAVLLLPKFKLLTTVGHRPRLGRRLLAVVRLVVRRRLRGAAVRPRDGPRDRSCAAKASRRARRCSSPSWAPSITCASLGDDALAEARVGLAGPVLGTAGAAACLVDRRSRRTATSSARSPTSASS